MPKKFDLLASPTDDDSDTELVFDLGDEDDEDGEDGGDLAFRLVKVTEYV
jgi:hypothetical protein